MDIVCIGEPLLEFNQQSDGRYQPGHGGDISNCAVAAARQGAEAGLFTHIGDDDFGRSFLKLWRQEGIDCSMVKSRSDSPTGIYFVTHGEKGHEFSYFRSNSASSLIVANDLPVDLLKSTKFLHISAISQAISENAADAVFAAIDIVRTAGGRISYDTNLRLQLWPLARARAVINYTVSQSDIILPGLEDAVQLTGRTRPDEIVDYYLAMNVEMVALTLGAQGTFVATPNIRKLISGQRATPLDATAAGDTFDGAFLAEICAGKDPFQAAHYANAAAALSTQGYGAVAPIPRRAQVEAFLAQNSG